MAETQGSKTISMKLERIAEIAKRMPGVALTSLSHHIDMDWMREAYRRTRKDGAVGVDEQTAAEYAVNLEENLASLLDRAEIWRPLPSTAGAACTHTVLASPPIRTNLNSPKRRDGCPGLREVAFVDQGFLGLGGCLSFGRFAARAIASSSASRAR